MKNRVVNKNKVTLDGKIISEFTFNDENGRETFYEAEIAVIRFSKTVDVIKLIAPERILDLDQSYKNKHVRVTGKFCSSYNSKNTNSKTKLDLLVYLKTITIIDEKDVSAETNNNARISGYICKPITCRKTPSGRDITDIMIAVNSPDRSEYIPCILWEDNAIFAYDHLSMGDHVMFNGRIQSREYNKVLNENEEELRTAYELSVAKVRVIDSLKGVKTNNKEDKKYEF